jgi:hypothetical protein
MTMPLACSIEGRDTIACSRFALNVLKKGSRSLTVGKQKRLPGGTTGRRVEGRTHGDVQVSLTWGGGT